MASLLPEKSGTINFEDKDTGFKMPVTSGLHLLCFIIFCSTTLSSTAFEVFAHLKGQRQEETKADSLCSALKPGMTWGMPAAAGGEQWWPLTFRAEKIVIKKAAKKDTGAGGSEEAPCTSALDVVSVLFSRPICGRVAKALEVNPGGGRTHLFFTSGKRVPVLTFCSPEQTAKLAPCNPKQKDHFREKPGSWAPGLGHAEGSGVGSWCLSGTVQPQHHRPCACQLGQPSAALGPTAQVWLGRASQLPFNAILRDSQLNN